MEPLGVFSIVDGYIEEISTVVPWKKLMTESTVIKVSGLQITLTALSDLNVSAGIFKNFFYITNVLVNSMIGSIASTMDLARSVIACDDLANNVTNSGVEKFAQHIDQVISKIKVIFENVIVRIESYNKLCSGIEIQIDKFFLILN